MQNHAIPSNTMQYYAIQCNTMQYHAISCNTMQYHAIQCNTMQYHAIPCNTLQYHAIPCNTMQYYSIPFIINNCWRSVPLPCGQYMAISIHTRPQATNWDWGGQLFCGGFNPGDGNDAARREPLEHEPFDQEKIRRPLMMIYQFFADLVYRNWSNEGCVRDWDSN